MSGSLLERCKKTLIPKGREGKKEIDNAKSTELSVSMSKNIIHLNTLTFYGMFIIMRYCLVLCTPL